MLHQQPLNSFSSANISFKSKFLATISEGIWANAVFERSHEPLTPSHDGNGADSALFFLESAVVVPPGTSNKRCFFLSGLRSTSSSRSLDARLIRKAPRFGLFHVRGGATKFPARTRSVANQASHG